MTKAMLLFLVTSIALGLTSLHLVRELRAERANAQSLQARVSALEAKASQPAPAPSTPFATWSVQKVAPPATSAAASTPPNAPDNQKLVAALHAAGQSAPAPSAPTQEEMMRQMQEHMERQQALMRDPEYREALRVQQRMGFVRSHPDLAQELGLTTEQADQFASLMAEQSLRHMDNSRAMPYDPAAGPHAAENAHRKAVELQQANEAEIAALLGPQKFKAWQEYQSTLGVRYQANELSQLLASNGVPLQRELTKPLMKVLAQEQQRMMQEQQKEAEAASRSYMRQGNRALLLNAFDEKHLDRMAEQSRRTREALSSILSPEQLEIYAMEQEANLQVQRAQMRTMREHSQATGVQGSFAPFVGAETVMYASPGVAVPVRAPDEE